MTIEGIAATAQRKGIDLLGTGDCLQPAWLQEIEEKMVETDSGLLRLRPDTMRTSRQELSAALWRPLHYVLSTEVCCAPRGTPRLGGIHHLLYFRSLAGVRNFRQKVARFGDLEEGRPTLALTSRDLLSLVLEQGDGCALAPAHVLNPWYSTLGSVSGGATLDTVFGDLAPHVLAIEMGLTSTPPMCRRISSLDRHTLFCGSDAHSLENLGREYTLLDIEPGYDVLLQALRTPSNGRVSHLIKFPIQRTRYYHNWCGICRKSAPGSHCPSCGRILAIGSHDRLEAIADRATPPTPPPHFQSLLPLADLIGLLMNLDPKHERVRRVQQLLLHAGGDERHILTRATAEELHRACVSDLAKAIIRQRMQPPGLLSAQQLSFVF